MTISIVFSSCEFLSFSPFILLVHQPFMVRQNGNLVLNTEANISPSRDFIACESNLVLSQEIASEVVISLDLKGFNLLGMT